MEKKRELLSSEHKRELEENPIPAFCLYSMQFEPQPAYIEIAPESDYPVWISYNADPSLSSMSYMAWTGREMHISIPAEASGKSLLEFIEKYEDEFWKVIDGYYTDWDGNNIRGKLTPGADEAYAYLVRKAEYEIDTSEVCWSIEDWEIEDYITAETDPEVYADEVMDSLRDASVVPNFDRDDVVEYIVDYKRRAYGIDD